MNDNIIKFPTKAKTTIIGGCDHCQTSNEVAVFKPTKEMRDACQGCPEDATEIWLCIECLNLIAYKTANDAFLRLSRRRFDNAGKQG